MKLTILGCFSAFPNKNSFTSSQLLEINGKSFLIDCGEGTQIQLRKFGVKLNSIENVFHRRIFPQKISSRNKSQQRTPTKKDKKKETLLYVRQFCT